MFAGLREAAPPKKGLMSNERTEVHLIKRHTKAHREYKGMQMADHICLQNMERQMWNDM